MTNSHLEATHCFGLVFYTFIHYSWQPDLNQLLIVGAGCLKKQICPLLPRKD